MARRGVYPSLPCFAFSIKMHALWQDGMDEINKGRGQRDDDDDDDDEIAPKLGIENALV